MKVKQALTAATCFCREAYRWVSRGIASIRPDELITAVVTRAQEWAGTRWGSGKGNRGGVEMANEPTKIAQIIFAHVLSSPLQRRHRLPWSPEPIQVHFQK